ncbi:MAG: hypothetical protein M0R77_16985, partial [Gammaproteobacteria bacterium]|nr:hypothetical protein [Gammaproteobacteria bacterium]
TGTTSITTTLANSGVSAGTYKSVTVDVKGRVTAGTNPTTLAGYGITDAISTAQFTPYVTPITTVTATTYDLVISDVYIRASNASPQTVTIPPNATVAFPVGYQISVIQVGAGQVSISPGSGVTVNYPESLAIRKQFGAVTLTKVGTNEWDLIGDTTLA